MILNTRAEWQTIVLAMTLLHSASVLVTVLAEGSECFHSGQHHASDAVYMPANCRTTVCMITSSPDLMEGLQCSIKNYVNHFPNACKEIKEHSSPQSGQPGEATAVQEICQATLASISLYMFHCDILKSSAVSLNFTFNFPLCGEGADKTTTARAVMVDFSADKEDVKNYFALNPICRVFDFTGSNFSHLTQEHQSPIPVSYDCIGVGLRGGRHLEVYYYLFLTTFPAGQVLKYTLVYRDVNFTSMKLAAAAWLSTSRVHVVFQPIDGVTTYYAAAVCLQKKINISEQVSSSSSVEISNIPPECIIVRISVTPLASECEVKDFICSPAILTLDRTGLRLPEESKQKQGYGWLWPDGTIIVAVIVSLITVAILVAFLLLRRMRKLKQDGIPVAEVPQLRVLCIASPSAASQNLHTVLKNLGFHVTDAVQDNGGSILAMRNSNAILISVHPSLTESNQFTAVMKLMKDIFTNQQLWNKVRVASYSSRGQRHLGPSEIFQGTFNNPMEADFLQLLDQRTFNLPEGREDLVEDLRCIEVSPTEGGVNRMTEGLDGHGVLSHQNEGVNGMTTGALGHVEMLPQQNGNVHGNLPRSGSHSAATRQYPVHCQEEVEGLISGGQEDDVVWVPHDPECRVVFQPENHTRVAPRSVRMCPEVLYHHVQGPELPGHASGDPPLPVDPGNVRMCQGLLCHNLQGAAELPVGDRSAYPVGQPAPVDPMHVRAYQGVLYHRVQGAELPAHDEDHPVYPLAAADDPPAPVDPRHFRTHQGALYHHPQEVELPEQAERDPPAYPCDDSDDDSLTVGPVWKLALL